MYVVTKRFPCDSDLKKFLNNSLESRNLGYGTLASRLGSLTPATDTIQSEVGGACASSSISMGFTWGA